MLHLQARKPSLPDAEADCLKFPPLIRMGRVGLMGTTMCFLLDKLSLKVFLSLEMRLDPSQGRNALQLA